MPENKKEVAKYRTDENEISQRLREVESEFRIAFALLKEILGVCTTPQELRTKADYETILSARAFVLLQQQPKGVTNE